MRVMCKRLSVRFMIADACCQCARELPSCDQRASGRSGAGRAWWTRTEAPHREEDEKEGIVQLDRQSRQQKEGQKEAAAAVRRTDANVDCASYSLLLRKVSSSRVRRGEEKVKVLDGISIQICIPLRSGVVSSGTAGLTRKISVLGIFLQQISFGSHLLPIRGLCQYYFEMASP